MKLSLTKRIASLACAAALSACLPTCAVAEAAYEQPELGVDSVAILEVDGYQFKDLNKNATLDVYEDWRRTPEERAEDLLSQMTATDKAAQMVHLTLVTMKESWFTELDVGFALVYEYIFDGAKEAAARTNEAQRLAESSRLGIPVVFSMDTEAGSAYVKDATFLPDAISQGAAGDVEMVAKLNEVLREELMAIGVRMALSPDADLITDPRWGRNQECYSEDTQVVCDMIVAAVNALQGGSEITDGSVLATVKHFPGAGAQTQGVDGTPLTIQEDSINLHLAGFKAAIAAGAAAVMPYGYSAVPYLGGDAVENSADQSSVVMTDLLRDQLGFTGLIQTDWGLNHVQAANSGADILGGAGQRETKKLVEGVEEEVLNDRVRRILVAKFKLGIFENPYVDEQNAVNVLGSEAHRAVAREAAAKSFTMLKYENAAPLAGQKLLVAGTLAENVRALNSGWTAKDPADIGGKSILSALKEKAGAENIIYIGDDISQIPADLSGTTAIVVIGEASGTHEPAWGSATVEFPSEQTELVAALDKAGANVISVVLMNRAYVLTEMVDLSYSMMLAYRPGATYGADAVASALFGETAITGKTPFQLPQTMEQVLGQREDLPKDIENPLFDYGFGIDVESFGK